MRKLIRILCRRDGETLVEVLCAAFILLIALAALQGAVRFAGSAEKTSETMGDRAVELQQGLREEADETVTGSAAYEFYEVLLDGTALESGPAFTVEVSLGTREAAYEKENGTEEIISFSVFLPEEETP